SSRRRHTRSKRDWSSDVCSSDLFLMLSGTLQLVLLLLADFLFALNIGHSAHFGGFLTGLLLGPTLFSTNRSLPTSTGTTCEHQRSEERRVGQESRARRGPGGCNA